MDRVIEMNIFKYPKQIVDYRSNGRWRPGPSFKKKNWTCIILTLKQVI